MIDDRTQIVKAQPSEYRCRGISEYQPGNMNTRLLHKKGLKRYAN
jgi:hypothetical protein